MIFPLICLVSTLTKGKNHYEKFQPFFYCFSIEKLNATKNSVSKVIFFDILTFGFGFCYTWLIMKKSKLLIILFSSIFALATFVSVIFALCKVDEMQIINQAIIDTKCYLENYEIDDKLFGNYLQSHLKFGLVYNIAVDEYLISYNNKSFVYSNDELTPTENNYCFFFNVTECFDKGQVGQIVFTKGYKYAFDGGNAIYQITNYLESPSSINISNTQKTITLKQICYNSTINIFQMGYSSGAINDYVNDFTQKLEYENIFIPQGEFLVTDNFDVNVKDKGYYGYKTTIFANDTYAPQGPNNGCLFYVYNYVSNIKIIGFDIKVYTKLKLNDPLIGFLTVRDADGVFVNNCSFYLPKEASIYATSGMIDLFTGWQNVTVKNCKLENHSSTVGGGGVGVRDIYKKECKNALFENNYIYSNCKDEVIAIFSGIDTSLYEDNIGGGNIENVIFKNNTIVGAKPNSNIGPRVVGLTVGYQVSPVKDIFFIENDITMYSANYLLLYGKTTNLTIKNNNIKIDSSFQAGLYVMFWHKETSQEGFNILVENNNIEMLQNSTLRTIAIVGEEFSFISNTFTSKYQVYRLLDSHCLFENNVFNIDKISDCIYRDIKHTKNNTFNVGSLNVVYEFYDLNIQNDILILGDKIKTESIGSNLMMFNGSNIRFNNHTVTFSNFSFSTDLVWNPNYYLAYDTTPIQDNGIINFINSSLSVYEDSQHNFVARDNENKIQINFIEN